MDVILVTGQSGAGKTQVVRTLEDMGFFCVDNLPPGMLPGFLSVLANADTQNSTMDFSKVAVVIDIRSGDFLKVFNETFSKLQQMHINLEVLYLDASDEVLIKRFKETRRKHPLEKNTSLLQAISIERNRLKPLKDRATYIVDTSSYSMKQLKQVLHNLLKEKHKVGGMMISVSSFGYKHGIPIDADIVFDVRFLPNPFYIDELRSLSGLDEPVKNYIFSFDQAVQFLTKLDDMVSYLIPFYMQEDKSHLVIALGCTGGRHRSVAMAEAIGKRLKQHGHNVYVEHRDIKRK